MNLTLSHEQKQIIESTTAFLSDKLPVNRLHEDQSDEVADSLWQQMAELGWFGLGLAEEYGGFGFTRTEEVLLCHEAGRHLAPVSIIATMLAVSVAALAGEEDLKASLMDGSKRVCIANALGDIGVEDDTLSGDFHFYDARSAGYTLYVGQYCSMLLDLGPLRSQLVEMECLDAGTSLHAAQLLSCPVVALLRHKDEINLFLYAQLMTAAYLIGQSTACLDMAVDYANTREQFGRRIGGFQSIKHRCSGMAVRSHSSHSLLLYATSAMHGSLPGCERYVYACRYLANRAGKINAADNLQIHGGIGFTDEHDAHLFVKRSHLLNQIYGGPNMTRKLLVEA